MGKDITLGDEGATQRTKYPIYPAALLSIDGILGSSVKERCGHWRGICLCKTRKHKKEKTEGNHREKQQNHLINKTNKMSLSLALVLVHASKEEEHKLNHNKKRNG